MFLCAYFISSAVFTTIKQLVDTPFNNANHIIKVKLSIVNKHINNSFAICKTHCKQSHQPISNIDHLAKQPFHFVNNANNLKHLVNKLYAISTSSIISANNLSNLLTSLAEIISLQSTCWDSYRQFTNSKQTINRIIYKKYILYDIVNKMINLLCKR